MSKTIFILLLLSTFTSINGNTEKATDLQRRGLNGTVREILMYTGSILKTYGPTDTNTYRMVSRYDKNGYLKWEKEYKTLIPTSSAHTWRSENKRHTLKVTEGAYAERTLTTDSFTNANTCITKTYKLRDDNTKVKQLKETEIKYTDQGTESVHYIFSKTYKIQAMNMAEHQPHPDTLLTHLYTEDTGTLTKVILARDEHNNPTKFISYSNKNKDTSLFLLKYTYY